MGNKPVPSPNQNLIEGLYPRGGNRSGAGGGSTTTTSPAPGGNGGSSTGLPMPNTPEAIKLIQQGFVWVPSVGAFINPTTEQVIHPQGLQAIQGPDAFNTDTTINSGVNVTTQDTVNSNTDIRERARAQENRYDSTNQNATTYATSRRYEDIPTAEEVLDDFSTGLAMHIQGLRQSGQLDSQAAQWIMENQSHEFLNAYLGKLGQMAKQGIPIFKTVGLNGNPTYLGSRAGQNTTSRTTGQDTRTGIADTESSSSQSTNSSEDSVRKTQERIRQNSTASKTPVYGNQPSTPATNSQGWGERILQNSQAGMSNEQWQPNTQSYQANGEGGGSVAGKPSGGYLGDGGSNPYDLGYDPESGSYYEQPDQNGNTNSTRNQRGVYNTNRSGTQTTSGTRNTATQETVDSNANRTGYNTEELYSRPKVSTVHTLAPSDFLSQTYSAADLKSLYEGSKGTPKFFRPQGPSSARRI